MRDGGRERGAVGESEGSEGRGGGGGACLNLVDRHLKDRVTTFKMS